MRQIVHALIGALALAGVTLGATLMDGPGIVRAADGPASAQTASEATCTYALTAPLSQVANPAIREASALAASRQWPGTYWTLNDSKNAPTVFAIDEQGQARGAFQVPNATNVDWEAVQIGPDGMGDTALYIGDIGDNDHLRRDAVIYRVPEPQPAAPGVMATFPTEPATVFRLRFPYGSDNVEAMLVHPTSGEVLLFSREVSGYGLVYSLPTLTESSQPLVPDFVGALHIRQYEANRGPLDGQITDGAISSDGLHVVLRTYASALVYDLAEGEPLVRIVEKEPRVYPLSDGPKGEGISFRLDSNDLLTIGEAKSVTATLFETVWHC